MRASYGCLEAIYVWVLSNAMSVEEDEATGD
jgi:hypothetical protein